VAEEARHQDNQAIWTVVEQWLKTQPGGRVKPRQLNTPKLTGAVPNPGYAVV
jgi:sulfur-oxidizing protein SoxB